MSDGAPKRRRRAKKDQPAEARAETAGADEARAADVAGEGSRDEPTSEPSGEESRPGDDRAGDTGEREDAGQEPEPSRGSAQTGPAPRRAAPRRGEDGEVVVRAQARYVRCAPRKARLVVEHIRGKSVEDARAILRHTPRHAARDVLKLLESCVSNAENNHELVADELVVHQAYVDEGPTIRRYRPRALGRATRIRKRTSHMTLTLTPKSEE